MLMDRFPSVIVGGAALLGWIGGDMMASDVATGDWVVANASWLEYGAPVIGAGLVVLVGKMIAARTARVAAPVDLAPPAVDK